MKGGSHEEFTAINEAYTYLVDCALGQTVDLTETISLVKQGDSLLEYVLHGREYTFKL